MIYRSSGDRVTLEMTRDDYDQLILMLGIAAGAASKENPKLFWSWVRFANELNTGNPNWTQYEIPEEFRR